MVKSIVLKKALKGTVFKGLSGYNKIASKRDDIILLHMGNKGISFNNEQLFEYLIANDYNKKYTIICSVESKKYYGEKKENVIYTNHFGGIKWFLRAKHVFYTAGQIPIKPSKKQIVIHMNHGTCDYKTMGALTNINNGDEFFFTYIMVTSDIYVPIAAKEYLCPESSVKVCSEPMSDRIIFPKSHVDFSEYNKMLLWVPTFRQSDYLGYDDSTQDELLPLFSEQDYLELNKRLAEKNILLLVKIHPSQSLGSYKKEAFSHLKIYSNDDFVSENMNLYDLMAQSDGLLGDYSSASMHFLITEKPIAYVIPDYEEYKKLRGFVFDDAKEYMPGHKIYTKDDFWTFLDDFSENRDMFESERIKIKNLVHKYVDGNSCERLLELSEIKK